MWSKNLFATKSFWLAVLTAVVGALTLLLGEKRLPPEIALWFQATLLPILMVIIRVMTVQPVTVVAEPVKLVMASPTAKPTNVA